MWKEQHYTLLLKYWEGQASEKEKLQVQDWRQQDPAHHTVLEELEAFHHSILLDQTTYDKSKGLHLLRSKIEVAENKAAQLEVETPYTAWQPALKHFLAIAASLVLVLGTLIALYLIPPAHAKREAGQASVIRKETGRGQRSKLLFPDGSVVYLNAESSIAYSSDYFVNDRTVHLQGEAYFEITPDSAKPFRVHTSGLTTEVLGTSFNIHAYQNSRSARVSVVTGEVSVQDSTRELRQLSPNQQLTYDFTQKSFSTEEVSASETANWTKGEMAFRNVPLCQIAADMERWYDVRIVVQDKALTDCRFTATFDNLSLKEALYLLSKTTNLTYIQHGRTITLQGSSCQ
ncbi:MAG: FecR domain-containing protein [Hymenobacteraceae bacterium]|nr:FecR domain-containing protein [Hymenobacteraceae bacterium]MDX5481205.1 FecR domain-containing protein [Hymenobacteraceae bacterium]